MADPHKDYQMVFNPLNYTCLLNSQIIIISTVLDFKDQKIDGHIYILTKDEAVESLKALIDSKLDELYG